MRIVNLGGESYIAHMDDGTQYGVVVGSDDTSATHQEIVEAITSGSVPIEPAPPRDVAEIRAYYLGKLDREAARLIGPATTEAHRLKLEEARDVLDAVDTNADGTRDASEVAAMNAMPRAQLMDRYPMLAASIGIDAPDLVGVAVAVQAAAAAAKRRVAAIEAARLAGKAAIKDAATADAAEAAYRSISLK